MHRAPAYSAGGHPQADGIYHLIFFWEALIQYLWKNSIKSVAVPILGLGFDGIPADLAASIAVFAIRHFLDQSGDTMEITLVLSSRGFPDDLADPDTVHDWKLFYRVTEDLYGTPPDMTIWEELSRAGLPNLSAFELS